MAARRKTVRQAEKLTRRERQIMDVIYASGRATAAQVQAGIPDAPSYSAVRALLRLLEEKGHVRHKRDGRRYVFLPVTPRGTAGRSALRHVVETFFDGSVERAVSTLLDAQRSQLSGDDLERLADLIEDARREGR